MQGTLFVSFPFSPLSSLCYFIPSSPSWISVESLVQLLLEHGASVEARNRRKETPIMCSYNVNVSKSLQQAANITSDGKESYIQVSHVHSILTSGNTFSVCVLLSYPEIEC